MAPAQVFSSEFREIFKNAYFEKHLRAIASEYLRLIFGQIIHLQTFWTFLSNIS